MLVITLPKTEDARALELRFEHSLVSLSKWEQEYEKPFFGREPHTVEETMDYFRMMVLGEEVPLSTIWRLTPEDCKKLETYINAGRTATTFRPDASRRGPSETITNELIYHWMILHSIPFDPCETWHLNRLMTLIKIQSIKNSKPRKMSARERAAEYRALNEQRRRELGSSG